MKDYEDSSVVDVQIDVKWCVFDDLQHYWMVESKGGLVDIGESWGRLNPQGGKLQSVVFTYCQKIQMILLK